MGRSLREAGLDGNATAAFFRAHLDLHVIV